MAMSKENAAKLIQVDGNPAKNSELLQPLYHFWSAPGKNAYRALIPAFNYWLDVPEEIAEKIYYISETLIASLYIIDDIEDGSELRRGIGIPAAHTVYSVPLTINCANYAQSIIFEHVLSLSLNHPKAMHVLSKELQEMYRATGKDIHYRETFECPTELQWRQEYIAGALFPYNVPIKLLKLFSKDERDLDKLISRLALFSQIHGDYSNLTSDDLLLKVAKRKSFCQDLTEGKFSFPIIHAINCNHTDSGKVAAILKQRTKDEDLKRYCVSLMENMGSFAYTREVLEKLRQEIQHEIKYLGGNSMLEAFLSELPQFLVQM